MARGAECQLVISLSHRLTDGRVSMVENRFSRSLRHVLMIWMNSLWGNVCSDLDGWARGRGGGEKRVN